ncbi:protein gar2 [Herrania umbratica]|uniref:Protein gar2 n=1 Tax=Herrania umbratica TaxID=108875 RepID=A0A6J1BBU6_9ROSI|nr:protein gar2 [Herrania umbratica]
MVLSNKKLKQKLRAELLANKGAEPDPDIKNPDSNSEAQSVKSLLDSVTRKPRLSKREKRRQTLSFSKGSNKETEEKGEDVEEVEEEAKKKRKKRKREEDVKEEKGKNKKTKKKKKNNKNKKGKNVSEEQWILQVENGTESQVREDAAPKVYVGGIPYRYTKDDIRYYFEGCGTILDVDCMKFPDTGKFRGIAIINFETEAAVKEALALDRAEMGGMQLTIQPYKSIRANNKVAGFSPKMVEGYNRIYVGNLSWDITEDDLKKLFSDCDVSSIRFGMDKETGEFRGYAHVDFSDSVSVAMALKLDQEIVCGRPVKISCAIPKNGEKGQSRSRPTRTEVPKSNEAPAVKEAPAIEEAPASNEAPTGNEAPTMGNKADNGGSTVSSGKLRRRTCYECGQKGHISSACPNKKTADTTNTNTN